MADHSAEIAEIEAILNAGIKETVNDGERVVLDFDQLRLRLKELKGDDDVAKTKRKRPRTVRFGLGGF